MNDLHDPPPFPMGRTVSRSADWLSDGVLVAHRSLVMFGAVHGELPHDGVWALGVPPMCVSVRSGLQNYADELCREPMLDIVLHTATDSATPVPEAIRIVPPRWQWEAITVHGSYVFDGRIALAALRGRTTDDWWWRILFAYETVPTLVGGVGDDRLFFLAGVMPAELVGAPS
jgi:hypothetical protein